MPHSPEQLQFFSSVTTTSSNILLRASAGSGKTTTILECLKQLPIKSRVLLLAFNKDIATELISRAPLTTMVSTFHSLGLGAYQSSLFPRRARVSEYKLKDLAKKLIPKHEWSYQTASCQLVQWAKSFGVGVFDSGNEIAFRSLIDHFDKDLEVDDEQKLIFYSMELLRQSNTEGSIIDFADMLYFPLLHKSKFPRFDYVFIDEAQDTNAVQRALLKEIVQAPARLFAVGDEQQAIYGFRGADSDAMNALKKDFNMIELDLSVSWRCSQAVVKEAQNVFRPKENDEDEDEEILYK